MLRESDSATWSSSHGIKVTRNPQIAVLSQRHWEWCLPLRDFHHVIWTRHCRVLAHYLGFVDLIQTFDSCELPHSLLSGPNHHPLHHWHALSLTSDYCPMLIGFQIALTDCHFYPIQLHIAQRSTSQGALGNPEASKIFCIFCPWRQRKTGEQDSRSAPSFSINHRPFVTDLF